MTHTLARIEKISSIHRSLFLNMLQVLSLHKFCIIRRTSGTDEIKIEMALMNHVQSLLVDIIYHLLNRALIFLEMLGLSVNIRLENTKELRKIIRCD